MATILEWNLVQPNYLSKASIINVKEEGELLEKITDKLKNALDQYPDLVYATANQIGYDKQVFAIRMDNGDYAYFANPLVARDGKVVLSREKEFGLENDYYVPRWNKVQVISYTVNLKKVTERIYENELACLIQHILNNLDGISIKDTGLIITPEFDSASPEEQNEVLQMYMNELMNLLNTLEKDIAGDSELNEKYEAVKIAKAINSGELNVSEPEPKRPNRRLRRLFDKIARRKKHD